MKFYSDGIKIRDEYGRQRIFRGENTCIKSPDMSVQELKNVLDDAFANYRKAGDNIIRLGVTWALIEPEEGSYNDDVIRVLHNFVKKCADCGIYIMLDMHQDLYSSTFYGDGMPHWAIDSSIEPKKYMAIWAEGYFYMDCVQQGFCDFWHNKNGVQDKFISAWKHLASAFDDCENVIGYDYLNEPYPESNGRRLFTTFLENVAQNLYGKRPDLVSKYDGVNDRQGFLKIIMTLAGLVMRDGGPFEMLRRLDDYDKFGSAIKGLEQYTDEFNEKYYSPFIDKCNDAVAGDKLTFFEHNYFANMGVPFDISTKENYIYSPHAYDLFVDSPLYEKYSSNERIRFITDQIRENQLKMNIPVMFGEWGCWWKSGSKWIDHVEYVMDIMEKNQWSNIYWSYMHSNPEFCHRLNRPYPIAVCGDIIEYRTDSKSRTFTLTYRDCGDCDQPTEIYVPRRKTVKIDSKKGTRTVRIKY